MGSFVKSATTSVPASRSQGELEKVLRRYGCSGFGVQNDYRCHRIVVHFVVMDEPANGDVEVPVRIEIETLRVCGALFGGPYDEGYSEKEIAQAERVAWRQLILWVDAACSAAAAGVQKMSEAFFAHTVVRGEYGAQCRLVDHINQITDGNWRGLLSPGDA